LGGQYQDLATLSGMSKFSAGQIQHFPGYHVTHNTAMAAKFENALRSSFFSSQDEYSPFHLLAYIVP
jgi:hypothetical protein